MDVDISQLSSYFSVRLGTSLGDRTRFSFAQRNQKPHIV